MSDETPAVAAKPRPLETAKPKLATANKAVATASRPALHEKPKPSATPAPTKEKARKCSAWTKFKWMVFILALLAFAGFKGVQAYGEWGAQQLVTEYVALDDAPLRAAGPLRIAFIADVHNNPEMTQLAVDEIRKQEPDIIFFGGDLVNAHEQFKRTRAIIKAFEDLAKIAPTYAILGNHDLEKLDQTERVFQKAKITLLRNEAITWTTPSGKQVRIIGLGDWNEYDEDPAACMKRVGEEELPVILLSHDPESRWLLRQYDWDLMLAGHTHGGQLGDPRTGELISLRSSMPGGIYDFEGNRKVYVTRGVGAFMNMRFFCPPEVTIIDIKAKN